MREFKVGDKVEVVDCSNYLSEGICHGDICTVTLALDHSITVVAPSGGTYHLLNKRFKLVEGALPDIFDIECASGKYTMTKNEEGSYTCTDYGKKPTKRDAAKHREDLIKYYIGIGSWKIINDNQTEKQMNGTDAYGSPLNFTRNDLKLFQRVVSKDGRVWIVTHPERNTIQSVNAQEYSSHSGFYDEGDVNEGLEEFIAVEVYDAPEFYSALNFEKKGKLLWKRTEKKSETQLAIEQLEASIKDSVAKLEQLKGTL